MSVVFTPGQELGSSDLDLNLTNEAGYPTNAASISYAIYYVVETVEYLVGDATRVPVNPAVGRYYAAFLVPVGAELGDYVIRWTIRQFVNSPEIQVIQEFGVISSSLVPVQTVDPNVATLLRSMRIRTRDNNPDRNYHFRPPTGEGPINSQNRVFGYIWEDEELVEYLERSLDLINMYPPETGIPSISSLVSQKPAWRTMLIEGALMGALGALTLNWIEEEFSIRGDQEVTVFLPDGEEVSLPIKELYRICHSESYTRISEAFRAGKLRVRSVMPDGIVQKCVVADVARHRVKDKRMMAVVCDDRAVVCTEDHSLFSPKPFVPIKTAAVVEGGDISGVVGNSHIPLKVTNIAEVEPEEFAYDLCVPGPENFVLTSGILAHNSYSIGGISLDLNKSSNYSSMLDNAQGQFEKFVEAAMRTVKITKGLRQSRYGIGIQSAFGPTTGRGIMSPGKFVSLF